MVALLLLAVHIVGYIFGWGAFTGWLALFLPGYMLLRVGYPSASAKLDSYRQGALAVLISVLLLGSLPLVTRLYGGTLRQADLGLAYWVVLGVIAAAYLIRLVVTRSLVWRLSIPAQRSWGWPVAACLLGVALFGLHFYLYPFLPEADGYGWGVIIREVQQTGALPYGVARGAFVSITQVLLQLTGLSVFVLFKYALPLLVWLAFFGVGYAIQGRNGSLRWRSAVALLSLAVPVLVAESLVARPQSLAFLWYLFLPFVLLEVQRLKALDLYVLCAILAAGAFGIHEITGFLLLAVMVSAGIAFWPELARNPRRSIFFLGSFFLLFGLVIAPTSAGAYLANNIREIVRAVLHPQINLWFIGSYRNADGIELGWPGWQAALYYGYNLGLLVPLLIGLLWKYRKQRVSAWSAWAPYWVTAAVFGAYAELFPRLGYIVLPDRSWIVLMAVVVPTLGYLLNANRQRIPRWGLMLLAVAALGSVGAGVVVTQLKQGRVSQAEFEAAAFIKQQIPPDSLILGSSFMKPLVLFFGERTLVTAPGVLQATTPEERRTAALSYIPDLPTGDYAKAMQALRDRIHANLATPITTVEQLGVVRDSFEIDLKMYAAELTREQEETNQAVSRYVIYSTDTFSGLGATRAWWRAEAFPDFPYRTYAEEPGVTLVYQRGPVWIWKIDS